MMGTKPLSHSRQKMLIIKLVEHISNKTNKNNPQKSPQPKMKTTPNPHQTTGSSIMENIKLLLAANIQAPEQGLS